MKKPFLCRIGFHEIYNDTVGENVGTDNIPIYFMTTYRACNRCNYRRIA